MRLAHFDRQRTLPRCRFGRRRTARQWAAKSHGINQNQASFRLPPSTLTKTLMMLQTWIDLYAGSLNEQRLRALLADIQSTSE
jgi:hypothetical protein